jgi:putative heme iron utilization protein
VSKAAERARALVASGRQGALATVSGDGTPSSSWVAFADDGQGRPLLLVSGLSEHTHHLRERPRASLLVLGDAAGAGGPMDRPRVTLTGHVVFLAGDEASAARARFVQKNPDAAQYASLPDFSPARLEVEAIRFVGGFARAASVSRDDYGASAPTSSTTSTP